MVTIVYYYYHDFIIIIIIILFRDATGTVQKSRKVSGDWGSGGRAPAGSRGSALVGVQGSHLLELVKARAFSQSELPRKPPIDTHGRYTYNTCTGKKVGRSEKVGIPTKVGKTASLIIYIIFILIS